MEIKHTPGPWYHHKASGYEHAMGGWVSATESRRDGVPICDIRGTQGQPYEANARLIAAAPDLLSALQVAELMLRQRGLGMTGEYRQIEDALAKAVQREF